MFQRVLEPELVSFQNNGAIRFMHKPLLMKDTGYLKPPPQEMTHYFPKLLILVHHLCEYFLVPENQSVTGVMLAIHDKSNSVNRFCLFP